MYARRFEFGPIAQAYDRWRLGYPGELREVVLAYAGRPRCLAEVGTGTGKATELFATLGVPTVCVEVDAQMAAFAARRFAGLPHVSVVCQEFEDWAPPAGGVGLLWSAQAWQWITPVTRCERAYAALAPGGTVALFEHEYTIVDRQLRAGIHEVYHEVAPELVGGLAAELTCPEDHWLYRDLVESDLFDDVCAAVFPPMVVMSADRYVRLLDTIGPNQMLPAPRRQRLLSRIAGVIEAGGGTAEVRLDTALALGRRAAGGRPAAEPGPRPGSARRESARTEN